MKRITRDFITLFNKLWYRDFPLSENHKSIGSRAEWTTHIGICVRSCADLMGYFTHFEQGNRTDAIIKNNIGNDKQYTNKNYIFIISHNTLILNVPLI